MYGGSTAIVRLHVFGYLVKIALKATGSHKP